MIVPKRFDISDGGDSTRSAYSGLSRNSLRRILPTFDFGKSSREFDEFWHFVARKFAPAEIAHHPAIEGRIATDDERLDGFPRGRIRHADHRAFFHARKRGKHGFDLIGKNFEA